MRGLAFSPKTGFGRVPACRFILVAAVAAGVALAAFSFPAPAAEKKPQPSTQVGVDAVITEPFRQTVPVIGRIVARLTAISARVNGPIGEVRVDVGDRVKAGDVIAVLVDDLLKWQHELQKAEVQQYAAAVKTRNATTKLRHQELQRIERLIKSAAFSQARLDDKRQEVAVAESQAAEAVGKLAGARANFKLAETNLSYATIRAPFPGVVSKRLIEVGTYVNIGDPLMVLIDNRYAEIEADVPANRLAGLTPQTIVNAVVNGGPAITARVRAIVPEENPQTRTRRVRFVPHPPTGLAGLANNQSVTLHLPSGNNGIVVTVHKDAILSRKGKTLVFLVQDAKAVMRPVQLGEAVGIRFIVNAGLVPGDKVVVRGNERLLPGQAIRIREPSKPAKAGG